MKKNQSLIGPPTNNATSYWFQLTQFSERNQQLYNYAAFCELIEKQVLTHLQTDLFTNQTQNYFNNRLSVQNLQVTINERQFDEILRRQTEDHTLFPMITFHATQNVSKVNSILASGYVVPGEQHLTLGYTVRMQNGNLYGDGIYSSPNFQTAQWFSFLDQHVSIQVIINLVFIKRFKIVHFCDFENIPSLNGGVYYEYYDENNNNNTVNSGYAADTLLYDTERQRKPKKSMAYKEYDTLISNDRRIIITGNANNIIPIGIATLGLKNIGSNYLDYLTIQPPGFTRPTIHPQRTVKYHYSIEKNKKIPCYRFIGDYCLIDPSCVLRDSTGHKLKQHVIFSAPLPRLFPDDKEIVGEEFQRFIETFYQRLKVENGKKRKDDQSVTVYFSTGNTNDHYSVIQDYCSYQQLCRELLKKANLDPKELDIASILTGIASFILQRGFNDTSYSFFYLLPENIGRIGEELKSIPTLLKQWHAVFTKLQRHNSGIGRLHLQFILQNRFDGEVIMKQKWWQEFQHFFESNEMTQLTIYYVSDFEPNLLSPHAWNFHMISSPLIQSIDRSLLSNSVTTAVTSLATRECIQLRHIFMIPPSLMRNLEIVKLLNQFINTIPQTSIYEDMDYEVVKIASFYTRHFHVIDNVDTLLGLSGQASFVRDGNDLMTALEALCDFITKDNNNSVLTQRIHVIYLLVTNPTTVEPLSILTKKWQSYLSVQQIQIKLLFFNDYIPQLLDWKSVIQTIHCFESRCYYQVEAISNNSDKLRNRRSPGNESNYSLPLQDIFQLLEDERTVLVQSVTRLPKVSFAIPYPLGVIGEGFVTSFHQQPVWDTSSAALGGIPSRGLFCKGLSFQHLKVNTLYYNLQLFDLKEIMDPKEKVSVIISIAQLLMILLNKFRIFAFQYPSKCKYYLPRILPILDQFMNTFNITDTSSANVTTLLISGGGSITIIKQLQYQCKVLMSDILAVSRITVSEQWFQSYQRLKFMKKIQQRFTYEVSSRTSPSIQTLLSLPQFYGVKIQEPSDCLSMLPSHLYRGALIRVYRSEAAKIEPWLLIIDYISQDQHDVASLYTREELSEREEITLETEGKETVVSSEGWRYDHAHQRVTDVFLLPHIPSSEEPSETNLLVTDEDDLLRLYYGYLFTRIPYCYHYSQVVALPVIGFVSLIHQAYLKILFKAFRNIDYVVADCQRLLSQAFQLIPTIQYLFTQYYSEAIHTFFVRLENHPNKALETLFLENNEIPSLCKVLGMLLLPRARAIWMNVDHHISHSPNVVQVERSPTLWNRFCFGLLSEAMMRSCKAYLRSIKRVGQADRVIREVLGISDTMDPDQYQLDLTQVIPRTNHILLNTHYSNCSPYSIISTLEFIELWMTELQQNDGKLSNDELQQLQQQRIFEYFQSEQCLPKSFLLKHYPNVKGGGRMIQLALFLLGMKYSTSKLRETHPEKVNLYSTDHQQPKSPRQIVDEIIAEQLQYVRLRQQFSQRMSARVLLRLDRRIEIASPYRSYHMGMPKIFTAQEVDDLNRSRPKEDQLRLMPTGLLFHHCCYPHCPWFLTNLATKNDQLCMIQFPKEPHRWKNHGLNHHLQNNRLLQLYVPNFHVMAKSLLTNRSTAAQISNFNDFMSAFRKAMPVRALESYVGELEIAMEEVYRAYRR